MSSALPVCKVNDCYQTLQCLITHGLAENSLQEHTYAYLQEEVAWHGLLCVWCVSRDLSYFSSGVEAERPLYSPSSRFALHQAHCCVSERTAALC